jgi:3-hydroxy-9,10-secoandrosta-1,3,5(10)-triene-9,17-dione monooxygenase reductase component
MTAGKEIEASVDEATFRRALGRFVTGVTVMTARAADGRLAGMTVNSFNTLSLDPPLVLWSIALKSPSFPVFHDAGRYAVNILAQDQQALARQFSHAALDKFAGVEIHGGLGGVPLISGAAAHLECELAARHPGGDHEILVGRVVRARAEDGLAPLAYCRGQFGCFATSSAHEKGAAHTAQYFS